ncbi:capsular polysaccharide transport system permease protein [Novosphingobium sp. CF614]|uniref:capsule biosynthesis protein n=1 Tax=Novosphingobium sp. CF614 TaxID=1884364 RepID=UPI0008E29B7C|nr:capsule biosynthesis protein [Novosphingobium sp. CF614]SFG19764.1 capsular polysaccharide transport system permease protein [Novosphingobium sp. CF614]
MKIDSDILAENSIRSRSSWLHWVMRRKWFLIFVLAPTVVAAIYYGLIASDVYISESRFVVKSPDQKGSQLSSLANLVQTKSLSSGQDQANEVLDYVRSRNALVDLGKGYDVTQAFAPAEADFLSRYPGVFQNNTFESLYKFYGKKVSAELDTETSSVIIRVQAFSPEAAYRINARLLDLSEAMVNRLNARAQTRGISEAEVRVFEARKRVRDARVALAQYRNASELIDPVKQAGGALEISNSLVSERATLQAQLDQMVSMTPRNPAIPALRARVKALSSEIAEQEGRIVGDRNGIASKLSGYEALTVEQEFATENLNIASAALVQARADAVHQKFYLERIVDPNRPDEPLLPRRLWSVIVVAASALCLYFIGWMLVIGILEHAPED